MPIEKELKKKTKKNKKNEKTLRSRQPCPRAGHSSVGYSFFSVFLFFIFWVEFWLFLPSWFVDYI